MYQIKNVILAIFLSCFSLITNAGEISKKTQDSYSNLVIKLTEKLAELDIALDNCTRKKIITEKALTKCSLNEEAIDGLFFVNLLAENSCTKEIQQEVLTLLVQERNYRAHHKITPESWNGIKHETISFFDTYLAHLPLTSDQSIDFEQMFSSTPQQQQTNLLNCHVLKKPFDVLKVADRLIKK